MYRINKLNMYDSGTINRKIDISRHVCMYSHKIIAMDRNEFPYTVRTEPKTVWRRNTYQSTPNHNPCPPQDNDDTYSPIPIPPDSLRDHPLITSLVKRDPPTTASDEPCVSVLRHSNRVREPPTLLQGYIVGNMVS